MTKEEAINLIIDDYKNGNQSAMSDYCDRVRCAECPFDFDDCVNEVNNTLIDRLLKTEEHQETNLEHYILDKRVDVHIRNEDEVWHLIFKVGTDDACYESRNRFNAIEWLLAPYKKPTYKLTQFEYDLLKCYDPSYVIIELWLLTVMQSKGYYKDIPTNVSIKDILDNCEVIEE